MWTSYAFQSTLSVRRATRIVLRSRVPAEISIHALRKESDTIVRWTFSTRRDFNPRSP